MLPSIFGENLFDDFFSDPFGMMNVHGHDPCMASTPRT